MSYNTVPVPELFAQKILNNEFVEFDNLLPDNLSFGACVQNTAASDVPIRGFHDGADAWAVYFSVVPQYKPD